MDQYNTLTPEIICKLKEVSDHILTGDDINPDFSRDEISEGIKSICKEYGVSSMVEFLF